MVEGEENFRSRNALKHKFAQWTYQNPWLKCVCKPHLAKKRSSTKEREKMKPFYAKVKAASHDKIYAIASKGSAKT
jgi:hypothetical protein